MPPSSLKSTAALAATANAAIADISRTNASKLAKISNTNAALLADLSKSNRSALEEISRSNAAKLSTVSSACETAASEMEEEKLAHEDNVAALADQKSEWETAQANVRKNLDAQEDHVKLNIGGVYYQTSKSTLAMLPYFKAMLGGGFKLKTDTEGFLFIDRNGEHFVHILSYLRGSLLTATIEDMCEKDGAGVFLEAEFYQAPQDFLDRFERFAPPVKLDVGSVFSFDYSRGMTGVVLYELAFNGRGPFKFVLTAGRTNAHFKGRLFLQVKRVNEAECRCVLAARSTKEVSMYCIDRGMTFPPITITDAPSLPGFKLVEN